MSGIETVDITTELWRAIPGQEQAVRLLALSAAAPVHAYLLAGPAGAGTLDAARRLAAALLCADSCGTCGTCRRICSGSHPDVLEIEADGTFIVVSQIEEIIREAFRAPFEASRKVIVISEADRLNETAANKLLKTLEEPAERTHFVLISEAPDELLPTIRSRCQQVEFDALTDEHIMAGLVADGLGEAEAREVVRLAAGRMDRARLLAGRWAPLRRETAAIVRTLDGSGATVAGAAQNLTEAMAAVNEALETAQKTQAQALTTELEQAGYPDRVAKRLRAQLEQRHQREARRAKTDALLEVVTGIEACYRDALIGRADTPARVTPEAAITALDACRAARSVIVNRTAVNETLLLEHLLLHLPRSA